MNAQAISFLEQQLQFERVQNAVQLHQPNLVNRLAKLSIHIDELSILIVAFKEESELEIYVKSPSMIRYEKMETYTICKKSGQLGPKRKSGDLQVPEGFYSINRFNPLSKFHLSLGINYPNESDILKSDAMDLGGDIFIHGGSQSTGCLPVTDEKMEEIYLLALHAKNNGQVNIPVYIFPFKMCKKSYEEKLKNYPQWEDFWKNLKEGYDLLTQHAIPFNISIAKNGNYSYL